jgi:DNA-binding beta-propeller fold protein YncE
VIADGLDRRELLLATGGLLLGAGQARAVTARARRPALALVTADTDAHVVVVSLGSGRVVGRIATGDGPRSIQSDRGNVLVGHALTGRVTVISDRPPAVRRVLRGFEQPRYGAFAPGGRHAFFSDGGAGEIAVIDIERARVVRRVGVGAGARHLGLSPDGRRLWVALGTAATTIVVLDVSDPLDPRVRRRVHAPFLAHDVAVTPDGTHVWVTAARERHIAIVRAATGAVVRRLPADEAPQHVSFGPGRAYVASGEGRSLRVHGLDDGRSLAAAKVPFGSYNVQRQFGRVLSPSLATGQLSVFDARGRLQRRVRVAPVAHDACVIA